MGQQAIDLDFELLENGSSKDGSLVTETDEESVEQEGDPVALLPEQGLECDVEEGDNFQVGCPVHRSIVVGSDEVCNLDDGGLQVSKRKNRQQSRRQVVEDVEEGEYEEREQRDGDLWQEEQQTNGNVGVLEVVVLQKRGSASSWARQVDSPVLIGLVDDDRERFHN